MTVVLFCLAAVFGVAMIKAWKRIDELEEQLETDVEQYEMGWADGYEVGRGQVRTVPRKAKKITSTKKEQ